jgi:hypothetical protein
MTESQKNDTKQKVKTEPRKVERLKIPQNKKKVTDLD